MYLLLKIRVINYPHRTLENLMGKKLLMTLKKLVWLFKIKNYDFLQLCFLKLEDR